MNRRIGESEKMKRLNRRIGESENRGKAERLVCVVAPIPRFPGSPIQLYGGVS